MKRCGRLVLRCAICSVVVNIGSRLVCIFCPLNTATRQQDHIEHSWGHLFVASGRYEDSVNHRCEKESKRKSIARYPPLSHGLTHPQKRSYKGTYIWDWPNRLGISPIE